MLKGLASMAEVFVCLISLSGELWINILTFLCVNLRVSVCVCMRYCSYLPSHKLFYLSTSVHA